MANIYNQRRQTGECSKWRTYTQRRQTEECSKCRTTRQSAGDSIERAETDRNLDKGADADVQLSKRELTDRPAHSGQTGLGVVGAEACPRNQHDCV